MESQRIEYNWGDLARMHTPADDTTLTSESEKELKSLLMKVKEESKNLA